MHFDVLGPLRAVGGNGRVTVPTGRASAALCWLVLRANETVTAEALARVLWTEPGRSAPAKARMIARTLAATLEPGVLETTTGLRLVVSDDAVDARRFERLIDESQRHRAAGRAAQAMANLREALLLWRGDPYPELERALPAQADIDRLVDRRLDAQEDLNALALRGGVDYVGIADLRAQVILHPDRPRLHRQLALALYRSDRQVEALDVLRELRANLGDPDGLGGRLQAAMLRHDPELTSDRACTSTTSRATSPVRSV